MKIKIQTFLGLVLLTVATQPSYSQMLDMASSEPSSTPVQPDNGQGFPIFRFSDNQWFELTIPDSPHPETGKNIEEERNRQNATDNSGRDALFSEDLEFLNQLQLRYKFRFK